MTNTQSRLAVVIGGGNGIGAACCRLMAQRGWRVAPVDLFADAAKTVASEIGGHGYGLDVRDMAAVDKLAADIEQEHGPVYALVVCSGAFQERGAPADLPLEEWRKIMNVNLDGTFFADRAFGTRMANRGAGAIVNIASSTAYGSSPLFAYGASKAGIVNLTQNLAGEWGRSGVRVNSVSPGPTIVPRQAARKPGRYVADMAPYLALGRRIQPPEIAEGVEFLISDRASAITGIDLLIDAGQITAGLWGMFGGCPPAVSERQSSAS